MRPANIQWRGNVIAIKYFSFLGYGLITEGIKDDLRLSHYSTMVSLNSRVWIFQNAKVEEYCSRFKH